MSLKLYMDHHVPMAVTEGLRGRGIDVITAHEDGAADWNDERLLRRACDLHRVIFSQDKDFLGLACDWQRQSKSFPGVIFAHQLRITIGQAIRDLSEVASLCDVRDMQDRITFVPL